MSTENIDSIDKGIASLLLAGEEIGHVGNRHDVIEAAALDGGGVLVKLDEGSDGERHVVVAADIMSVIDARARAPRRRVGTAKLSELESLIAYVNRYKSANTIAWADATAFAVQVVFDDHPASADVAAAEWRGHRAIYTCPRSAEWLTWCEFDGKPMSQDKFGDFVESRLEDLRGGENYPKPLDVLAMARNFVVRSKGTFERQINPVTGEGILINKLENETGSTVIPRAFLLGISVFEGGAAYQVEARVRFAIVEGRPAFAYTLHRRKEIERDAFADVRTQIVTQTSIVLLAGMP